MRALAFALVSVAPLSASAYAVPMERTGPPSASVRVVGAVEVRDVRVTVRCVPEGVLERGADCTVTGRYDVVATGAATVTAASLPGEEVRFDDGVGVVSRTLAAGDRTRVVVTARRRVETGTRLPGAPWVYSPMAVRHGIFGQTTAFAYRGGYGAVVLFSGAGVTVVGGVALDADGGRRVEVSADESMAAASVNGREYEAERTAEERGPMERRVTVGMSIAARTQPEGPLRNGGPVLAAGSRMSLSGEGVERFVLRGSWEASLWEYAFVAAAVETDFESVFESVVVDVANPALAIIVPSFRAGVGAVARQLGPRPADFAMRLRVGGNFFPLGSDVDFDYWPSIGGWTLSVTGRFSL